MDYPSDGSYTDLKRQIRIIIDNPSTNYKNKLYKIWRLVK